MQPNDIDKKTLITILTRKLNRNRNLYHTGGLSEMTNEEYDTLLDKLKQLEKEENYCLSDSPTRVSGEHMEGHLETVIHAPPIYRLEETYRVENIAKILKRETLVFMPNLKGITVKITYEHGNLVEAVTQGDGIVGQRITENARTFLDIPTCIPTGNKINIIGTAFVPLEDFETENVKLSEDAKWESIEQYVEDSILAEDPEVCRSRKITFAAYAPGEKFVGTYAYLDKAFSKMEEWHIPHVPFLRYEKDGWKEIEWYEMAIEEMQYAAAEKGWGTDGTMIRYNTLSEGKDSGDSQYVRKYGCIYKSVEPTKTTEICGFEWEVDYTGVFTPVVIVKSTYFHGSIVTKIPLKDKKEIEKLKLDVGDSVKIAKSVYDQPMIVKNLSTKRINRFQTPMNCPMCGNLLIIEERPEGEALVCTTRGCYGRRLHYFMHMIGKDGLDVPELTEKALKHFIMHGYLRTAPDIFRTEILKQQHKFAGLSAEQAEMVFDRIDGSHNMSLEKFIYLLDIPGVDKIIAHNIAAACNGDYADFILKTTRRYDWSQLVTISKTTAKNIQKFYSDESNLQEAKDLFVNVVITKNGKTADPRIWCKNVVVPTENTAKNVGELTFFTGKRVAITGTFSVPHRKIKEILLGTGAFVEDRLSEKTQILICEKGVSNVDTRRAIKKGLLFFTYEEMLEKLNEDLYSDERRDL